MKGREKGPQEGDLFRIISELRNKTVKMAPLIKENSVLSYTNLYVARCFRNAFVCMLLKQKELPCNKGG